MNDDQEPTGRDDSTAIVLLVMVVILVIFALVWGVFKILPGASQELGNYIENIRRDCPEEVICPEPTPCPESETIIEYQEVTCPDYVCPGCPRCPDDWRAAPDAEPNALPNYLTVADQVIADMHEAAAIIEELASIQRQFGDQPSSWRKAFTDTQWLQLYESMNKRVDSIRKDLLDTWPPPPYDSTNPLLDSHGRLLMAYIYLDKSRGVMRAAVQENNPTWSVYYWQDDLGRMETHITNALVGMNMAR